MSRLNIIAAFYVAIAVGTFGHSAAYTERKVDAEYSACRAQKPDGYCFRNDPQPAATGLVSAVLWPLYWSWEAWR